jgi:signal-transduction protein with cAMP-binding, CBS, and nucleotidyltransferase domain
VTYPDETLYDAIAKLLRNNIGRMPVVERHSPTKVVGYLGRAGILAARQRYHEEEDVRERGGAARDSVRKSLQVAPEMSVDG